MADDGDQEIEAEAPRPKKQKTGGFKWKDKRAAEDDRKDTGSSGLHRGYRDRSPRKDSYREREKSPREDGEYKSRDRGYQREDYRPRDGGQYKSSEGGYRRHDDRPQDKSHERRDYRDSYRGRDSDRRRGDYGQVDRYAPSDDRRQEQSAPRDDEPPQRPPASNSKSDPAVSNALSDSTADKFGLPASKSEKKDKAKKPRIVAPSEPMIIVNINDRLGTKAAIPCLASDSVKAFKAIVAAHIGRQPHEIMLKRQGERPFKDQLTLEDYGVSSGVQLDLEIDTGD